MANDDVTTQTSEEEGGRVEGGRRRCSGEDARIFQEDVEEEKEDLRWKPVRLRASDIAKCVGVHPFAEIDELFMNLIYQGAMGAATLKEDAEALGAVLETKEEAAERTLGKASRGTREAVERAAKRAMVTKTADGVTAVVRTATEAVDAAVKSAELSEKEGRDLKAHFANVARTDFGRRAEHPALRQYEQQTGSSVSHSNDRLFVWNLPGDNDDVLFCIVGKIDGIAVEARGSRRVVIEVKNRVNGRRPPVPPELYDQIQLLVYMYLAGCELGDLVQCVRGGKASRVEISRVTKAQHENDWKAIILPRLYDLARAVDDLRRSLQRRRAFLAASPKGRWDIAATLCDWLPHPSPNYAGIFFSEDHDGSNDLQLQRESTGMAAAQETRQHHEVDDDEDLEMQHALAASLQQHQ
ncbi:hypothetical protein CTAYLR_001852 [Chrysophaeum taylorii]|uniref:PD-(D/E)XK endonuclease-like domain-containing protein n=1 Tax=Chrysophaeum taylorii TaxID=2483200 RepID=A0AAD7U903_9STRA|nr:hypothetical protein CTAYLR_001852 [Chrysophaeum taylorii]